MQSAECRTERPSLAALQRWLQAVITHPAGVGAGIESDAAQHEIAVAPAAIETVVLRSSSQSSLERLAVYGSAYFLRLLECLREFFPCLTDALGTETFDEFAAGYLQRHPPASYTLHALTDRFAEFLAETQPAQDAPWAGFVVDLARLEMAIEQVFDAPGPEPDPWPHSEASTKKLAVPPGEFTAAMLSAETRLVPTPGLTLLEFQWPVSSYYTDWKRGIKPEWPQPQVQFVALLRRDYVVRRHELSRPMFDLLSQLTLGLPIGQAVSQLAASHPESDLPLQSMRSWFTQWTSDGFFAGIARE